MSESKKRKSKKKHYSTLPTPVTSSQMKQLQEESQSNELSPLQTEKPKRSRGSFTTPKSSENYPRVDSDPTPRRKKKGSTLRLKKRSVPNTSVELPEEILSIVPQSVPSQEIQVMVRSVSYDVVAHEPKKIVDTPKEKRSSKWFGKKTSKNKKKATVFGSSIPELVRDSTNTSEIPVIIRQCVDYLMTEDG